MKFILALLAGLGLAALTVPPVGAQDSVKPAPCAGVVATDPAGDQQADPFPLVNAVPLLQKTEDTTDGRAVFFNLDQGADGKPRLTANLVVTNLTKEIPALAKDDGMTYTIFFEDPTGTYIGIQAANDGGEITYRYREYVPLAGPLTQAVWTPTTGEFHEGPMGVVSMVMPAALAKEGIKLDAIYGRLTITSAREEQVLANQTDYVPDVEEPSFTIKACPPPAAPAGEQTDTTSTTTTPDQGQQQQQPPPSQPQPQPQPAPAPQGQPAPGSPLPATGTLSFDAAIDKGKRKTAVKRGLRGRLRCSVQCKVTATAKIDKRTARKLKLGRKAVTIGKGKASITKAGRIPFYVKLNKKAKRALKRKGVKKFALKVALRVTDNQGKQVKKVTRKSTLR